MHHIVTYLASSLPNLTSPVSTSFSWEHFSIKHCIQRLGWEVASKEPDPLGFQCQVLNLNSDSTIHRVNRLKKKTAQQKQ